MRTKKKIRTKYEQLTAGLEAGDHDKRIIIIGGAQLGKDIGTESEIVTDTGAKIMIKITKGIVEEGVHYRLREENEYGCEREREREREGRDRDRRDRWTNHSRS